MKKIVCFLAILGIVISGVLFVISLTAPLEAKPADEVWGVWIDSPNPPGWTCISNCCHTCFSW